MFAVDELGLSTLRPAVPQLHSRSPRTQTYYEYLCQAVEPVNMIINTLMSVRALFPTVCAHWPIDPSPVRFFSRFVLTTSYIARLI